MMLFRRRNFDRVTSRKKFFKNVPRSFGAVCIAPGTPKELFELGYFRISDPSSIHQVLVILDSGSDLRIWRI